MDATLRAEITGELSSIGATAPVLMTRANVPKLYEIFVVSCLMRALKNMGAQLEARDKNDKATRDLQFRLGPGDIYSPSSTPGFIYVAYKGREYEIQNGIRVCGRSSVQHELDVSLIDRVTAMRCRQKREDPRATDILFVAECKFYGSTLDLALGREYLGLSNEFSLRVKTMISNVSNTEVAKLIRGHQGTLNAEISPVISNSTDRFTHWLETELRQVLG